MKSLLKIGFVQKRCKTHGSFQNKKSKQICSTQKSRKVKKETELDFHHKALKSGLGCANLEGLPEKRNCNAEHGDLSVQGV